MLTPRIPLLVLVGGLLAPLAVAGGLRPAFAPVAVLAAVLLAVTAAIDAWLCQRRAGRGLTFEFPEIVRLSKGRPGGISFVAVNDRPGAPARSLRVGLGFPDGVRTPDEELDAQLATGVVRTLFTWPCTGDRRGDLPAGTRLL